MRTAIRRGLSLALVMAAVNCAPTTGDTQQPAQPSLAATRAPATGLAPRLRPSASRLFALTPPRFPLPERHKAIADDRRHKKLV